MTPHTHTHTPDRTPTPSHYTCRMPHELRRQSRQAAEVQSAQRVAGVMQASWGEILRGLVLKLTRRAWWPGAGNRRVGRR